MIITGKEAKEQLLEGINKTADLVKTTLGAKGKTVLIQDNFKLISYVTKDGVTVAKSVSFEDDIMNLGSEFVKEAARKTVEEAGDSTTTTCILTQSMCNDMYKELNLGKGSHDLIKDLKEDLEKVSDFVRQNSKKVETTDDIENIASVSSNNDPEIGKLFKDLYDETGFDVAIDIVESDDSITTFEVVNGFTMKDTGYSSPQFVNNPEKGRVEFHKPMVFMVNAKIKQMDEATVALFMKHSADRNSQHFRPVVIICEDVEETVLREIVTSLSRQNIFNVAIVQSNLIFEDRKNSFIDASVFLDAEYQEDRLGKFGECEKIIIEKDNVTFINGKGDVSKHLEKLEKSKTKNIALERRIFALKSTAAIIKVGGKLATEISEKRDRIEDSMMAVKSSIEEGYSPGGSTVFLFARDLPLKTNIMKNALISCYKQLMVNAEIEPFYHLKEIYSAGFGNGYNLIKDEVSNMYDDGIFDSTKALRVSLENAVHTACTFSTIESVITK